MVEISAALLEKFAPLRSLCSNIVAPMSSNEAREGNAANYARNLHSCKHLMTIAMDSILLRGLGLDGIFGKPPQRKMTSQVNVYSGNPGIFKHS